MKPQIWIPMVVTVAVAGIVNVVRRPISARLRERRERRAHALWAIHHPRLHAYRGLSMGVGVHSAVPTKPRKPNWCLVEEREGQCRV